MPYPVIIIWEEPSGHLRFTEANGSPWPGENEGQFLDRAALDALIMHPEMDPSWRRPNILRARIPQAKRWYKIGRGEVQVRNCLRLVGGQVRVGDSLLRAEYLRALREERGLRLDEADRQWMRAFSRGRMMEAADVEAYRERLRNLPAVVEAAIAGLTAAEIEQHAVDWPADPV